MIRFDSDYMAGAHPEVLDALVRTNLELTAGYGNDPYTLEAKEFIRKAIGCNDAEVMFLVGGTQTNATAIDGILARHEGVLAAESGHIAVHESGAIEASGHKVLTLPHYEGKVKAEDVRRFITEFYADETYQHMVAPGMLYISQPTEYGTIYSLSELTELSEVCHSHEIPLYIDGARLGYALGSSEADFTLEDIARLADVFYIGGTKMGTLFGEALVVTNRKLLKNLFPLVKQHGALLAKGRLLGLQFGAMFRNGLYEQLGSHATKLALRLREIFRAAGYEIVIESPTNQQFVRLPNEVIDKLRE
ncbi:MAG: aminotransferase class I/II-fold pyridoxal phosphate-dependent enzyme, partial [Alistipes sp.]|nr:aminotransferase class I/II-fold pyridoxal phosphate-dependent enzyme [Alistipes sp.]